MRWTLFAGIGIGVAITPVAAMLAMASAGAGHGHYELARVFFPYTMLLTRWAGDSITLPLLVLALAQFPLYGAIIGIWGRRSSAAFAAGMLLLGHAVAVVVCFSGVISNFS
jgi:hypothetical protein